MQQIPALFYAKRCSLQLPNLCTSFNGFFLTTLSHSHTLVLQTVAPIHHIPLCINGHSNTVLTDHLCVLHTCYIEHLFLLVQHALSKLLMLLVVQTWKRERTWRVLIHIQYFVWCAIFGTDHKKCLTA